MVVGAEHVAYSAVLTLRHAGVATVAMVTELPRHQTVAAFALAARVGLRVPLRTSSRVSALHGHGRLEAVDVEDLLTGRVERVAADTVVFTGDWVPDHELARRAGLAVERTTLGPRTDGWGRTTRPGVLAAGNLVHPGETAGRAALGGTGRRTPPGASRLPVRRRRCRGAQGLAVTVARPLASVVPSVVDPGEPPPRLLLRTSAFTGRRLVVARQGGREVGRHGLRHSVPNRRLLVPGAVVAGADPDGGPVELSLGVTVRPTLPGRRGRGTVGGVDSRGDTWPD